MTEAASVQSPCTGICSIHPATELCAGCYRTLDEIGQWWDMSPVAQAALLVELEQRQVEQANFD